ncbi:translation factor SUA5 [Arboricoccus pini]|uniref:Threonylcarbamoyl-AMP synthase n=1 Tax=Arboricoccus pini TaxID=1963835 RepID=A0A212QTH5_9PROT|nr:L-threonylcarbamoyladenylate synthase [Arboricoccus pini]SNB62904.1 translation factor SUA5 [Arboricoccus pini]
MTIIQLPSATAIDEAAGILQEGGLVAFPTETVYGLGCLATSDRAVAAAYAAKGRPAHNPLIIHLAKVEDAEQWAVFDGRARRLASAFWPGPLTLVLSLRAGSRLSPLATAGLETVAIRVPAHPVARDLLAAVGGPIAGPSANPSGRVSPTIAAHVAADLAGKVDLVLDGGPCPVGIESTVLDLTQSNVIRVLREGGLARERIVTVAGELAMGSDDPRPRSPGQLASHYAPRAALRLNATSVEPEEALLAFGPMVPVGGQVTLNLSPSGDTVEAASNLYAMLRRLDESGVRRIAVMPLPSEGLGAALKDRLARAAAPRA